LEKYLEHLETANVEKAVECLQRYITPRSKDSQSLYKVASLIACKTKEQLYERSGWDGSNTESRKKLMKQLLKFISFKKIMDSKRLEILLTQALQYQISQCKFHNSSKLEISLMHDHQCKNNQIPTVCIKTIMLHTNEVWNVFFSLDGKLFATISRDNVVFIWSIAKKIAENKVEIRAVFPFALIIVFGSC